VAAVRAALTAVPQRLPQRAQKRSGM
jgi:hypothetical protein